MKPSTSGMIKFSEPQGKCVIGREWRRKTLNPSKIPLHIFFYFCIWKLTLMTIATLNKILELSIDHFSLPYCTLFPLLHPTCWLSIRAFKWCLYLEKKDFFLLDNFQWFFSRTNFPCFFLVYWYQESVRNNGSKKYNL